jgi:hypothetical protein
MNPHDGPGRGIGASLLRKEDRRHLLGASMSSRMCASRACRISPLSAASFACARLEHRQAGGA